MAAGQGYKEFVTGEVLTAGDVNGYLMQGVLVFASAAARNAAITSPQEGQFAFTKDTNGLWYYDGAAWVASGATGDIEGVTATSPLTGGGTSGTVTVGIQSATTAQLGAVQLSDSTASTSTTLAATANAVKTTYDIANAAIPKATVSAKGSIVAATAASTPANLSVGANNTVLTADSSTATGLKWATVASGGMTLLASGTLSGTSVSLTSISQSYENLIIFARDFRNSSVTLDFIVGVNGNEVALAMGLQNKNGTYQAQAEAKHYVTYNTPLVDTDAHAYIVIPDYTFASVALVQSWAYVKDSNTQPSHRMVSSAFPDTTAAITSVQLNTPGTWGGGTYELWGQK